MATMQLTPPGHQPPSRRALAGWRHSHRVPVRPAARGTTAALRNRLLTTTNTPNIHQHIKSNEPTPAAAQHTYIPC